MSTPRFTVIMPLYNHAAFVGAAIESVLGQSHGDFELIVCNDGSTDASLEVVHGFVDARIRIIDKPNGGTVSALNACLMRATGDYLCWLSSDDLFAPDKLLTHHRHHAAHQDCALSVAPFGYLQGTEFLPGVQIRTPPSLRLAQFVFNNYINGLSVCAHRALYDLYGVFDARFRYAHDVERWFTFFRFEEPGFIEGGAQTYTRLSTGHAADAELLGQLDVLKFLCGILGARGIQGLIPERGRSARKPAPTGAPTAEELAAVLERVFHPGNLFHRFHMRAQLVDWVAAGLRTESLRQVLAAAESLCLHAGNAGGDLAKALADVRAVITQNPAERPPSFVEHVSALKGVVASPEQRVAFDRFLRVAC